MPRLRLRGYGVPVLQVLGWAGLVCTFVAGGWIWHYIRNGYMLLLTLSALALLIAFAEQAIGGVDLAVQPGEIKN